MRTEEMLQAHEVTRPGRENLYRTNQRAELFFCNRNQSTLNSIDGRYEREYRREQQWRKRLGGQYRDRWNSVQKRDALARVYLGERAEKYGHLLLEKNDEEKSAQAQVKTGSTCWFWTKPTEQIGKENWEQTAQTTLKPTQIWARMSSTRKVHELIFLLKTKQVSCHHPSSLIFD
jgi:hypothetical protein